MLYFLNSIVCLDFHIFYFKFSFYLFVCSTTTQIDTLSNWGIQMCIEREISSRAQIIGMLEMIWKQFDIWSLKILLKRSNISLVSIVPQWKDGFRFNCSRHSNIFSLFIGCIVVLRQTANIYLDVLLLECVNTLLLIPASGVWKKEALKAFVQLFFVPIDVILIELWTVLVNSAKPNLTNDDGWWDTVSIQ